MKPKLSIEAFEKLENAIWLEFLTNASSENLFKSLVTSNFDGNRYLLNWLKDNSNVDKGTMLSAYWMSCPRWYKQFKDRQDCLVKQGWGIDNFDFIEEVEKKYIEGFYKGTQVFFDPKSGVDSMDWTMEYMDLLTVRDIPVIMFKACIGKRIIVNYPEDFDSGLPMSYSQIVYDLFDEYEVKDI